VNNRTNAMHQLMRRQCNNTVQAGSSLFKQQVGSAGGRGEDHLKESAPNVEM